LVLGEGLKGISQRGLDKIAEGGGTQKAYLCWKLRGIKKAFKKIFKRWRRIYSIETLL